VASPGPGWHWASKPTADIAALLIGRARIGDVTLSGNHVAKLGSDCAANGETFAIGVKGVGKLILSEEHIAGLNQAERHVTTVSHIGRILGAERNLSGERAAQLALRLEHAPDRFQTKRHVALPTGIVRVAGGKCAPQTEALIIGGECARKIALRFERSPDGAEAAG
jgi:hypothetical protein